MISRKQIQDGTRYSVAKFGAVDYVFAVAKGQCGWTLAEQAQDALQSIQNVFTAESSADGIIKLDVFLHCPERTEECYKLISDFFGDKQPAITIIPQKPADGALLVIEAMGIATREAKTKIERRNANVVIVHHDKMSFIHSGHCLPNVHSKQVYDRSAAALRKLEAAIGEGGVGYDHVVRTWLYLGDIVGPEGDTQRYKELNRARADFYKDIRFGAGYVPEHIDWDIYPASTGIGADGKEVTVSALAINTPRGDVRLIPLENPNQTAAFDYRAHYSPKSPKFSRAMAVMAGDECTIYISGTASITDSETRYIGDPQGQTNQTLDNIAALISGDNFRRHGQQCHGATLNDVTVARIYVKIPEHYEAIREICEQRMPGVPKIYTVADVCRDDLLVEIEGIAFC